ncbi:MAG TPA: tetratricopeptide repeat protein [Myxococcales bacterium]
MDLELAIGLGATFAAVAFLAALHRRRRTSEDAAQATLKGFRYVLSDEPDQAIAELTSVAQDARTIETYFALGALFRRTGEHERAIRLHQNMLLKPELEEPLRSQIRQELALDYQRAGMHERAVEAWGQLLEAQPGHAEALSHLREIHEERGEWAQAVEAQTTLVEAGTGSRLVLAHLLAEAGLVEGDAALAARFASKAAEVEPASAHAALAAGLVLLKQGKKDEAAASLSRACELDPEQSVQAAGPLAGAGGEERAVAFFEGRLASADHAATRVALAGRLREIGKVDQALVHLRRALELDPRYVEARVELGRALLESNMGEAARQEMQSLLETLGQQEPCFRCKSCGQGYAEPQFRCAACRNWDTVERRARSDKS